MPKEPKNPEDYLPKYRQEAGKRFVDEESDVEGILENLGLDSTAHDNTIITLDMLKKPETSSRSNYSGHMGPLMEG